MSNKSGFELRTEILQLATNILTENAQRRTEAYYANRDNKSTYDDLVACKITTADIIGEAKALYSFVETK